MSKSSKHSRPWFQRRGAAWGLGILSVLFVGTWLAGKICNWPWPDGSDWQAIWTFFTFLIAAVAAAIALAQLSAHQETQREQSRPYVIVDFAFRSVLLMIEVTNIGKTPAHDVRFSWDAEPVGLKPEDTAVLKRKLVDGEIPFLAPGRSIRQFVGRAPDYWKSDAVPKRYEVECTYRDTRGANFGNGERMVLDLAQWNDALADTDYDNKNWNQFKQQTAAQKDIANKVRQVATEIEVLRDGIEGLHRGLEALRNPRGRSTLRAHRRRMQ